MSDWSEIEKKFDKRFDINKGLKPAFMDSIKSFIKQEVERANKNNIRSEHKIGKSIDIENEVLKQAKLEGARELVNEYNTIMAGMYCRNCGGYRDMVESMKKALSELEKGE